MTLVICSPSPAGPNIGSGQKRICAWETPMLGRADVVRILMNEGVQEVTAWLIALGMNPSYLEAMDEAALRSDVDNIIWNYVERLGNLEAEHLASVS